ncbi:uncharacterized protein [Nicotiana tomentosiformis]|uniref:uncharacterized protein n=1 Tax=Nicotiana tomentosiformis TaxID=4098 RepID=UPI00388CA1DB
MNNVCVQGFDGGGKDFVGDIMLELLIGPIKFTMEFQVLDVVVSNNLLLDRPWIHVAKAIPSSLHQIVKFEWDEQEIVLHGDEDIYVYNDPSIPFIEAEDDKGPWVYQTFEIVSVEKIFEGECIPGYYISFFVGSNDMTCIRNFQPSLKNQSNLEIMIQELEYDEEAAFEKISKDLKQFEEKPKPNLNDTEAINLGDQDNIRETKISVHLEPQVKEEIIKVLFEYKNVFAWSYDDMSGLSTDLKDGKTRVCVDYRNLNKASPKDDFLLPNIHILIDNCAKHEIGSFMDCYVGYHQILMDEEDAEKTAFITPWGIYYYQVMPFGLKNVGAIYMKHEGDDYYIS